LSVSGFFALYSGLFGIRKGAILDSTALKKYLLLKPEAEEYYPFDDHTAVFKVQGKMFALLVKKQGQLLLNLKCAPDHAIELRDIFPEVIPAYHMNKRHWNSVILDGDLPMGEIERLIDHSYGLVVKGLKKSIRDGLEVRYGKPSLYVGSYS
jgi:predicted DNA-binding protein (MmcQ/YjbR family)